MGIEELYTKLSEIASISLLVMGLVLIQDTLFDLEGFFGITLLLVGIFIWLNKEEKIRK